MLDFLSWSPHLYDDIQVNCCGHVEAVTHCYLVETQKQQASGPTRLLVLN